MLGILKYAIYVNPAFVSFASGAMPSYLLPSPSRTYFLWPDLFTFNWMQKGNELFTLWWRSHLMYFHLHAITRLNKRHFFINKSDLMMSYVMIA
jgi:hypothetical protein